MGDGLFDDQWIESLMLFPDRDTVFATFQDDTAMTWDLSNLPRKQLSRTHAEADMVRWWADLASDPKTAYAAIWRLAETPSETLLPFLRSRLRPVAIPTAAEWKELMAGLDHRDFRVRAASLKRLEAFGAVATDLIQGEAVSSRSAEARDRLSQLAAKLTGPIPPPETLRFLRALAVLEEVNTPAARRLVEDLTHGVATARETKAALATLARMPDSESWRR